MSRWSNETNERNVPAQERLVVIREIIVGPGHSSAGAEISRVVREARPVPPRADTATVKPLGAVRSGVGPFTDDGPKVVIRVFGDGGNV